MGDLAQHTAVACSGYDVHPKMFKSVKLFLCLTMETYGRGGELFHHSWPQHYMEVSGQLYAPAAFPPVTTDMEAV
jgi:hypothetical protein